MGRNGVVFSALPCYTAVYTLFVCVVMCSCIVFVFGLLRPLLVIGSGLALTAACFVLSLFCFRIGQCLVLYVPKWQHVGWGPLASHVRRVCTGLFTFNIYIQLHTNATATTSSPPTLKSPSIVSPSSTMVQDIAKAVCEAVIQSLTLFMVHAYLQSASGSVSSLVKTPVSRCHCTGVCGFYYKFSLRWAFIWGGSSLMKIASFRKSFYFAD